MGKDDTTLPSGTTLLIGPPTGPQLSEGERAALAAVAASVPGILEAHVPQITAAGSSSPPRQVLFVVLADDARVERVTQAVAQALPAGVSLDVLPLTMHHELLPAVQHAGSRIFVAERKERPWWRFWG